MVSLLLIIGACLVLAGYTAIRAAHYGRRHPPIGRFATIDGVRLHYVDQPLEKAGGPVNSQPALVFIHGASGNLKEPLAAFEQAFNGRYRTIFVDRPGHGHSQRGGRENSSPARQARLIDSLLDHLGVEQAILVGHSWGGSVAAAFGVHHKKRTAGLVFIAPATHPWEGGVTFYYSLTALPVIGWIFTRLVSLPIGEAWMGCALRSVFSPEQVPDKYRDRTGVELVLRPDEFRVNALDVSDLHGHVSDMSEHYEDIACPSLIITGDQDAVVYAEIHSEGLFRDIQGARLIELKGAGHMPHHTRTAEIAALIDEMAAGLSNRQAAE